MNAIHRNESGFALATAILALVVVGALVTAGFFAASQEGRVGTSNAQADLAFYVAEQGIQHTLGTVKKRDVRGLDPGATYQQTGSATVGGRTVGNWRTSIRPFGGEFYYLESVGTVTQGGRYAGATRRLGTVVRTMELNFPTAAAFTSGGDLTVAGQATVSGVDTHPSTSIWPSDECDPAAATEAGIRMPPDATLTREGNSHTIEGDPPVEVDSTVAPETFHDFGDYDLDQLKNMASHVIAGGEVFPQASYTADGACNRSDPNNWGLPSDGDPCSDYFPIIYSEGSLGLNSNRSGQGILIVDGDLTMNGSFQFYGIVIVTGRFNRGEGGGGFRFHGTMLVGGGNIGDSTIDGQPNIQFSTCTVTRALEENDAVARLFPVQERSWFDLTAAGVDG
ncbi:MAG TPA: pilus assembly PilX N-terminal domain-containing protein [Longimicrobiales bacterium]|nr:pilus assembly PilX N-terminal domain-containing protein [Longimicrobiales bacterium]